MDLSGLIHIHGTVMAKGEFNRLVVGTHLVGTTVARIYSVFRTGQMECIQKKYRALTKTLFL